MAKSQRATMPRRPKARSRQISDQIARAVHAHAAVNRACRTRMFLAHYADRQVAGTVHVAAAETARLAAICGSVETTARVLGLTPDEVQHLIRRAYRRGPDRRPKR